MQELGFTRSAHRADHILQTPDTFVRAPLPGMKNATAIVHVAPARGSQFTQYTAEFQKGGALALCAQQRFVYVVSGELKAGKSTLGPGGYAYLPSGSRVEISAIAASVAAVIEKPYLPLKRIAEPKFFAGTEASIDPVALGGNPKLEVRSLIPAHPGFDFAVNTMLYQPGAGLPMVEIHVMEHGLLMLQGGGIYRLGDSWYPTTAGDFIYMAPYCPQWFGALGDVPAKYLIYKDWNR
jgi:(S)-ureidoglycine aminohydrolase